MGKVAGGYVSQIEFNNGKAIDIAENDIVLFVGPNNAGKSQSLSDIYRLAREKITTTVIKNIKIIKSGIPVSSFLKRLSIPSDNGSYCSYNIMGNNITVWPYSDENFRKSDSFGEFRDAFIANLTTYARLSICNAPSIINRNQPKQHPIHYAAYNAEYRKWLSKNFAKAFGVELTPNTQFGASIPLCIGAPVHLMDEYEDEQARQEAYAELLSTYKQVQNQGDGVKSFTGILLYLMLDYFRTYLIDEPESFLHPPQARIMGEIIGNTLTEHQQAFISTHSEELIKGLLEVCPERIKIIRITREGDVNYFSVLDNEKFSQLWNDPLLRYSNIMSSLFHKSVVLCESDSDCKIYSIIDNYIKQELGKYSETLFIHCGGKHRMARIVTALKTLNIDVKLIADIDVLNDEKVFRDITEAVGMTWAELEKDYKMIGSNLHSPKEKVEREIAKVNLNRVLDNSEERYLSGKEINEIQKEISTISKWQNIKKMGKIAISQGDATEAYNKIEASLMKNGVFLVPVGELECFVKAVGNHGPEWVNAVLEKYPDFNDAAYDDIKKFIKTMDL